MLRPILLYLSQKQTPKKILTGHALGRRMAARFIAGEELEDALASGPAVERRRVYGDPRPAG